jgi:hypothetical protein
MLIVGHSEQHYWTIRDLEEMPQTKDLKVPVQPYTFLHTCNDQLCHACWYVFMPKFCFLQQTTLHF